MVQCAEGVYGELLLAQLSGQLCERLCLGEEQSAGGIFGACLSLAVRDHKSPLSRGCALSAFLETNLSLCVLLVVQVVWTKAEENSARSST